MRVQFAALLAVATFLASVTAAADEKMAVTPAMGRNDVPASRLLRTGTTTEEDDEERGLPLPALESVASLSRSKSQKQQDELVDSGLGSINSFAALKLDNAGKTLFSSPELYVWMRYVNKIENNPTAAVLMKLKSHFGDRGELAIALNNAARFDDTASKLQTAQFEQWNAKGWESTADIVDNVFKYNDDVWRALVVRSAPKRTRRAYSEFLAAKHPTGVDSLPKLSAHPDSDDLAQALWETPLIKSNKGILPHGDIKRIAVAAGGRRTTAPGPPHRGCHGSFSSSYSRGFAGTDSMCSFSSSQIFDDREVDVDDVDSNSSRGDYARLSMLV
ncbi:hypothetical protein PF011_g15185, partial [Phytophthora fragariae]